MGPRALVLVVGAMMGAATLAGCSDDGEGPEASTSSPTSSTAPPGPDGGDCDVDTRMPTVPTWAAHGGSWEGFLRPDADRPQGIRGDGAPGEPGLGLLIDHASGPFDAVEVEVDLALVYGRHPDGAGLVFHWTGDSYNIVRYSPSEGGWHLFTVIDGNRSKVDAPAPATVPKGPSWCEWVTLRVVADGHDIEVFQDGETVLSATLQPDASAKGQAGLFVRGDSVALFDGYAAREG